MRWSFRAVLVMFSMLTIFTPVLVSADSSDIIGQQIKITAVVLPSIYVVIDSQNQIQQIISNTFERDTAPTIYKDAVKLENVQPSTPELQQQLAAMLKGRTVKPGIVFKHAATQTIMQDKKVLPLLTTRK